jgi:hypothetical protein
VKLDIAIPESGKIVLLQEDKFKSYYNDLKFMLAEYARIGDKIIPMTSKVRSTFFFAFLIMTNMTKSIIMTIDFSSSFSFCNASCSIHYTLHSS